MRDPESMPQLAQRDETDADIERIANPHAILKPQARE
jgi:hypothetical protein